MEATIGEQERILASPWGGGTNPFGTTWGKFMMWVFIISDSLTFAAIIVTYGFMRSVAPEWPNQAEVFDMRLITFMTFALISSSAVMAMAVGAAKQGDKNKAVMFMGLTILGGAMFLASQVYEWSHFIAEGATLTHNPWGVPQFGAIFYVMTGFHGLHVFSGLVLLLVTAIRAKMGKYTGDRVEIAGLYWHFIDVVWVFIFAFFYLL